MKKIFFCLMMCLSICAAAKIDRHALITRNNPQLHHIDTLGALSVGNGEFAFTCDITGLQTFPDMYRNGVPLGTMSQWGWHSFPNVNNYEAKEVLRAFDFGRGKQELYSCQIKTGREKEASDYLRANPHRLHLGTIGFEGMKTGGISNINQHLDLWNGEIVSKYDYEAKGMEVRTLCDPDNDRMVAEINDGQKHAVTIRFPYPTGKHSDDACDWMTVGNQKTSLVKSGDGCAVFKHSIDDQDYYVKVSWKGACKPYIKGRDIRICPKAKRWMLAVEFCKSEPDQDKVDYVKIASRNREYWNGYWMNGGVVDFSKCKDSRAKELERRVVLSQYLTAIQCAGSTPPQETGLTYNSWFGKFHLEMIWWHMAHFPLWGHEEMLERTLPWYRKALPMAKEIAERQGFDGARWMKMTDPSGAEAPSNVGSFLIWQQPHLIYLAELLYRSHKDEAIIREYSDLIDETARFMASFASYDAEKDRYVLKGCIPAQETLKAAETVNPPFELSYWHFALQIAQEWRERQGMPRVKKWDDIIGKMSSLCAKDGVYAAAETAESYNSTTEKAPLPLYSDHMAVLGAYGVLPKSYQFDARTMNATLNWVMDNWNWDKTWGWDYPTTCMNAVRLNDPETAINALLMDKRTNTYLINGHNYQDGRLRCYLPGNGGLLTAVALMCAGWDGCEIPLPGFPKDGNWKVEYENILPLP